MRKHHILSGMAAQWVDVMAMIMVPTIAMRAQFSLHDIDIQVCINELGNARISESRQVTVGYTGSEGYIRMQMKQGRQVGELSVTDDTGTKYETLSDWDVDKSRRQGPRAVLGSGRGWRESVSCTLYAHPPGEVV